MSAGICTQQQQTDKTNNRRHLQGAFKKQLWLQLKTHTGMLLHEHDDVRGQYSPPIRNQQHRGPGISARQGLSQAVKLDTARALADVS